MSPRIRRFILVAVVCLMGMNLFTMLQYYWFKRDAYKSVPASAVKLFKLRDESNALTDQFKVDGKLLTVNARCFNREKVDMAIMNLVVLMMFGIGTFIIARADAKLEYGMSEDDSSTPNTNTH